MPSEFVARVFSTVDSTDVGAFVDLLSDDARVTFGNAEPLVGGAAVGEGLAAFYASIGGLRHEIVEELTADATTLVESRVTYTRLDGGVVTLPAATVIHRTDTGHIDQYRIYFDTTPVYA